MNHQCEIHGIEWLVAMALLILAMLACMLTHNIKNLITIGRCWT